MNISEMAFIYVISANVVNIDFNNHVSLLYQNFRSNFLKIEF